MHSLNQAGLATNQTRPRSGCLGCLGKVVLALLFGCVLLLAITALLAPWAFYMGGTFHPIPYWQGWGRLHSNVAGGDYVVYVQFEPNFRGGSRMYNASNLKGIAYLCTPRGERFRMHLGGDMRAHLNRITDGEHIRLWMDNWPALTGQFLSDRRPAIELRGQWQNPRLVMDDHGSISNAFNADGSAYLGHGGNRPYNREILPITLQAGSYSEFEAACPAAHR